MRNFEWLTPEDDPDDWGHGGCIECFEEDIWNQTAILIARFHLANKFETDLNSISEKYETKIWPWNTRLGTFSKIIPFFLLKLGIFETYLSL